LQESIPYRYSIDSSPPLAFAPSKSEPRPDRLNGTLTERFERNINRASPLFKKRFPSQWLTHEGHTQSMLTRSFNTKVEGQLATLLDRQQSLQTSIPAAIDIYQKDTQAHIVAQTKSLICLQGDAPDDILTRLKRIENGDVRQPRSLSRAIGAVESLSAAVHSNQSKLHDRLDSLEAIMQRSTTLESPQDLTGSDAICRAVRAEMRNIMLSLADDVAGSETWRKDLFKNTVDSVADQIGRDLQFSKLHAESSSSHSQQTTDESFSAPWDTSNKNTFTEKPRRQLVQQRIWTHKCSFGSIAFRLTTLKYLTIFSTRRITKSRRPSYHL
jgi:hypothetical protein